MKNIPWWAYIIFVYLLWIGFQAHKPRVVSIKQRMLLPILLIFWSLWIFLHHHIFNLFDLFCWILSFSMGAIMGWSMVCDFHLHADKKKHLMTTPGGWSTLTLLMLVFLIRFFFEYQSTTHPEATRTAIFYIADLSFTSFIAGIFTFRTLTLFYKYIHAHHTDLFKSKLF